jgi:hypothetical protein
MHLRRDRLDNRRGDRAEGGACHESW